MAKARQTGSSQCRCLAIRHWQRKRHEPTKSSSTLDDDGYDSDEEDIDADSEYATWLKGNAKAYMIIHKTVGADALKAIKTTDSASEAWTLLKERYQNKGFYLIGQSIDEFLHMSYNKDEDIAKFNDKFKNAMMKIQDAGLTIPASFYIHLYLS